MTALSAWIAEAHRLRLSQICADVVLAAGDHWQAFDPAWVEAAGLRDLEKLAAVLHTRMSPREPWGKPPRGKGFQAKWGPIAHATKCRIFTLRHRRDRDASLGHHPNI